VGLCINATLTQPETFSVWDCKRSLEEPMVEAGGSGKPPALPGGAVTKTLPGSLCPRMASANLAESEDEAKALEAERSAAKRCEAERFGYYLAETY
jgi:hypothetical protein